MKIELELHHHLMSNHQLVVIPNFYWRNWECDLFTINKNLYTTEYEVKISKSDFKNDFKKRGNDRWRYDHETQQRVVTEPGKNKHELIQAGERANRFYFVTPKDLLTLEHIPNYAGLMEWDIYTKSFHIRKVAPRLHKENIDEKIFRHLITNLNWRYYRTMRKLVRHNEKAE